MDSRDCNPGANASPSDPGGTDGVPTRRERIVSWISRMVSWADAKVPRGLRSLLGLILVAAGLLGFLPILGFWMIPLGGALIALDIPPLRRRLIGWLAKHRRHRHSDGAERGLGLAGCAVAGMRFVEITAVFAAADQAQAAAERVRQSVKAARIRVGAQCTVHVTAPATAAELLSRICREGHALDVAETQPLSTPGWMSHQYGRVTGTGIEPGAGDSEAGSD